MPAKIKKQELATLHLLTKTNRVEELIGYIIGILKNHGCTPETHVITTTGFIIPRPK